MLMLGCGATVKYRGLKLSWRQISLTGHSAIGIITDQVSKILRGHRPVSSVRFVSPSARRLDAPHRVMRLLTPVLAIAVAWTALSLLLAGSWVLVLEIGRRAGSARRRHGALMRMLRHSANQQVSR